MTGGNAANVAVGLSRLGFKTAIVAEIGEDEFAQKNNKFSCRRGEFPKLFFKKHTINPLLFLLLSITKVRERYFAGIRRKEQNFSFENISAKWLYLTALSEKWEEAYKKALEFTKIIM